MRVLKYGLWMVSASMLAACATHPHAPGTAQNPNAPISKTASGVMIYDSATMMAPPGQTVDMPTFSSSPDLTAEALPPDAAANPPDGNDVQVYKFDGAAPDAGAGSMSLTSPVPNGYQADMSPPPQVSAPMTASTSTPVPSQSREPRGIPYSGDPSVEIFPLDGSYAQQEPGRMPPSDRSGDENWATMARDGSRLYFRNGSAALDADHGLIGKVAAQAGTHSLIRVEGHASRRTAVRNHREAHIVNLNIAMQRAVNVSKALIRKGVPAKNIKTTAWGDTRPPQDVDSDNAEAAARRVEIYLDSQ